MASPYINRFLSADTVVPNPSDPQAFNRYSYVYNNPLRYIDPSGHGSVCGFSYSDPDCPPVAPKTTTVSSGGKTGGGGGTSISGGGGAGGKPQIPDLNLNDQIGSSILSQTSAVAQTGGDVESCAISGVATTCTVIWEVDVTVENLDRLEEDTSNLAAELVFAASVSAFFAPPLSVFFGWEAYGMDTLSDFFGNARDDAAMSLSSMANVSLITSEEAYLIPSIAYTTVQPDSSSSGSVYTPISIFSFIYVVMLEVRP